MKRSYIKHAGKKVRAWSSERVRLKRQFLKMGITTCELRYDGCFVGDGLGFAHAKKRRFLSPDELSTVILACNHCHDFIEGSPEMESIVLDIIRMRNHELNQS